MLFKRFALIFTPLAILISALLLLDARIQEQRQVVQTELNRQSMALLVREVLTADFEAVETDIHILARLPLLRILLDSPGLDRTHELAEFLALFAAQKSIYEQIHYLDASGRELIRINTGSGKNSIVSSGKLQNNPDSDYFPATFRLAEGELYVSPMHLNVEQGAVELPYRPVIDIATPVFDSAGRKRGIILIKLSGHHLISHFLEAMQSQGSADAVLVDSDGYRLSTTRTGARWESLFGKPEYSFAREFPQAWQEIHTGDGGLVSHEHGLIAYTTVYPLLGGELAGKGSEQQTGYGVPQRQAHAYQWKVVSFVTPDILSATAFYNRAYGKPLILLASLLLGLLAWMGARITLIHELQDAEKKSYTEQLELLQACVSRSSDVVMIAEADATGKPRIVYVNDAFEALTGYKPAEIIGKTTVVLHGQETDAAKVQEIRDKCERWEAVREELVYYTRSGQRYWVELDIAPVADAQGVYTHWIYIQRNITARRFAEAETIIQKDRLRLALNGARIGIWDWRISSGEVTHDENWYALLGYSAGEVAGNVDTFISLIHPDDRQDVEQRINRMLTGESDTYSSTHRLIGRLATIWVRDQGSVVERDEKGEPVRIVGGFVDVTSQHLAEAESREMHKMLNGLFQMSPLGVALNDMEGKFIDANPAFLKICGGYNEDELKALDYWDLTPEKYADDEKIQLELLDSVGQYGPYEKEYIRKDGSLIAVSLRGLKITREDGQERIWSVVEDITERKWAEDAVRNLAYYDTLTQLPNRRMLLDRLHTAQLASDRSKQYGAILFMDMDRFKILNDTKGHDYGDLLLIEVACRTESCVREVDTVARIGGDEFVVLIEQLGDDFAQALISASRIAEKIRVALAAPYELSDITYHSSPSIGGCLFSGKTESIDALLKQADMAMYRAKYDGRNLVRFFEASMQEEEDQAAEMEAELRTGLSKGELKLYYQVQMNCDGKPIGAEALIRWQHPERGMLSSNNFIPLAEKSDLIFEIGDWVLETACRQLAEWGESALTRDLKLAVNVSSRQFKDSHFGEKVAALITRYQIKPAKLTLELTEAAMADNNADVMKKMAFLKARGISLTMDDFGLGYSSLSHLKDFPVDQIKIDLKFVRDMLEDESAEKLVRTIIGMAESFQMDVIAEGVETEAQLLHLKRLGCSSYQGYLFSRAVPVEQFLTLLDEELICSAG